jgi:hypothetical protein
MRVGNKSSSEIREKLANMQAKRNKSILPSGPIKKPGFITGEKVAMIPQPPVKVEVSSKSKIIPKGTNAAEHLLKSDIASNRPDDEMTQEKLKGLLRTGGFSFSDKERKALSSILSVK